MATTTTSKNTSIDEGIMNAPAVGMGGAFYAYQYIKNEEAWKAKVAETKARGIDHKIDSGFAENCPCGDIIIREKGNYIYLYKVSDYGDWDSVAFTDKSRW